MHRFDSSAIDMERLLPRETQVKSIYALITERNANAVQLTGGYGIGKSTLAWLVVRLAEQRKGNSNLPGRPIRIQIQETHTFSSLAAEILAHFGKSLSFEHLKPSEQARALFDALESVDNPALIVLDQFERLLEQHGDDGDVPEHLPALREWLLLLDTQPCCCRFLLVNACSLSDPALGHLVQRQAIPGFLPAEGVAFLQRREVTESKELLEDAVTKFDGHGAALELLAILLDRYQLDLSQILNDRESYRVLRGIRGKKIFDLVYDRLSAEQKKLLCALAIYREAVPIEALKEFFQHPTAVHQHPTNAQLQRMLDDPDEPILRHLIQREGRNYRLQSFMVPYLRDRINQPESLRAHAEAASYYKRQYASASPNIQCIREAVWHYCRAEQRDDAYELMRAANVFANQARWHSETLLELYNWLLDETKVVRTIREAFLSRQRGRIYKELEEWDKAERAFRQAVNYYEHANGDRGVAETRLELAQIHAGRGEIDKARDESMLTLGTLDLDAIPQKNVSAKTCILLGDLAIQDGKPEIAHKYYEKAMQFSRKRGEPKGEARAFAKDGEAYYLQSRLDEALKSFANALSTYKKALDVLKVSASDNVKSEISEIWDGQAGIHNRLGQICLERGWEPDRTAALKHFELAYDLYTQTTRLQGRAEALSGKGDVYLANNDLAQAKNYYEQARNLYLKAGYQKGKASALNNLGRASTDLGQAENYYLQALKIYAETQHYKPEIGHVKHNLALLYKDRAMQSPDSTTYQRAVAYHEEAETIFRNLKDERTLAKILQYFAETRLEWAKYEYSKGLPAIARAYFRQTWEKLKEALIIQKKLGDRLQEGIIFFRGGLLGMALIEKAECPWPGSEADPVQAALACLYFAHKVFTDLQKPEHHHIDIPELLNRVNLQLDTLEKSIRDRPRRLGIQNQAPALAMKAFDL